MPLVGVQQPRILVRPPSVSSAGTEAVDLAAEAGLFLDPWQQFALEVGMGESADGKWSAFEVGVVVSRQNGKGSIFEALALAKLVFGMDDLLIYSSHEYKTSREAFRRIGALIDSTPTLSSRVLRSVKNPSEHGYDFRNGARLRFFARTGGSGRGWTADTLFLDEAFNLGSEAMAALLPTLSARPNAQVWYASSAALATSDQLHAVRSRALRNSGDRLAYLEWSAPEDADTDDREAWAMANPALGARMSEESIAAERAALPEHIFRRERLSIPDTATGETVIPLDAWIACGDTMSTALDPLAFAVDISPDRARATISVAGMRSDGKPHVAVVDARPGTDWITARLIELYQRHSPSAIALDAGGPAGSLMIDLEAEHLPLVVPTVRELTQSCGRFYDLVTAGELRHRDEGLLNVAVASARRRAVGEAWAWARKDTASDITPLYSATLALWAFGAHGRAGDPGVYLI